MRSRRPLVAGPLPLLPPLALLALVILLGVGRPHQLWLQGGIFAALALAWLGLRYARSSAPVRSTRGQLARLGTGAALVGVAGLLALPVGTWASGGDADRVILRTHVDPPFDVGQYPSPLASFRRYVALPAGRTDPRNLHDTDLFTIEGVPVGSRVRLAVLDRYDGVVWGASNNAQPAVPGYERHLPARVERDRQPRPRPARRRPGHHRARAGAGSGCRPWARSRPCGSRAPDERGPSRSPSATTSPPPPRSSRPG